MTDTKLLSWLSGMDARLDIESKPAPDARLEPEPEAAQDDQWHGDPAGEPGCLGDVCDRSIEIAEDRDAEHQMERPDEDALL
jgi:hypothetical protein